jgi:YHS domain-containing protein
MNETQCQVCGKGLKQGEQYSKLPYEGRTYYVCCPICMAAFQKDPARHIKPIPFMKNMDRKKEN